MLLSVCFSVSTCVPTHSMRQESDHLTDCRVHPISPQEYTITLYLHQTWKDSRLAYHETDQNLTLDHRVMLNKLWVPDCYFLNGRNSYMHDETVGNHMFLLQPDGTVHYGTR